MKTTTNAKELLELNACEDGYETYFAAHGETETPFSKCLESNSVDDVLWLMDEIKEQLSKEQRNDLMLFSADCAERVLPIFEKECPDDDRPRKAIQAARAFVAGEITQSELDAARGAARAAWAAARAARGAARAAWAAARAARGAARDAETEKQKQALASVFSKWEQEQTGGEL